MSVLDEIVTAARVRVERARADVGAAALAAAVAVAPPVRPFAAALRAAVAAGRTALIGEIKRASPSRGVIRRDFDPAALAHAYAAGGATCLSVLTEPDWFGGALEHIGAARGAGLPVLRKDFIVDAWQVDEARAAGADCVLLIVAALDDAALRTLAARARALGMDVLAEAHDAGEMARAVAVDVAIVGVNNRDLGTLAVDPELGLRLLPGLPAGRLGVAESGFADAGAIARYRAAGVGTFLVGESLMREDDVAGATRRLLA